ncbi:MAG TPA: T9SS type A sorting domain-containing protein [Flavobacteriales bacterium]|nr:T9SS type A sorting domain-containing protein [Flavobacteriales bacterium]
MKKLIAAFGFAALATFSAKSQFLGNVANDDHLTCLNNKNYVEYCKKNGLDPHNNPAFNEYEAYTRDFVNNFEIKKAEHGRAVYVIPVVFHVVHLGGVENISDAQIHDEIKNLNINFNKLNADTTDVIPAFKPLIANMEFEFRLAQKDALGNCVSGITRHYSATTDVGDNSTVNAVNMQLNGSSSTTANHYPRNMYLNIWVVRYAQGAAGYTNTPLGASFGSSKYDGIWVLHNYVGSIGTSTESHSRCLTHEIGHWFNLMHCWGPTNNPGCDGTMMSPPCDGDDNCTVDDGVTDTPNTIGWTSCNLSGASCGSPADNVQNYMEYSYCSRMFTEGQKARVHAAANSSLCGRNNLWKAANLAATGTNGTDILCDANFTSDATVICAGDSVQFSDLTYHGATNWSWNFGGGAPGSTSQNPMVTFNTPGQYTVTLDAGDGTSTLTEAKTQYITVLDPVGDWPFDYEDFEGITSIPNADWFIYNSDGQQQWQLQTGFGSSGTKCIKLDNFTFNNEDAKDHFLSETYNMSGATSIHISFKYAYKMRTSSDLEKLKLSVTNNCGLSWSVRKQVNGSAISSATQTTPYNSPVASDWQLFDVTSVPATFYTEGFRFRIEFESDYGNNIYVDDINLEITVGTNDILPNGVDFTVYPNPATDMATISYGLPIAQNIEIYVSDVLGKRVMTVDKGPKLAGENKATINTAQLHSKGIYFVTINSNGITRTQKIVVE